MTEDEIRQVLGVDKDADAAAVKAAYRKIAHETHPDRPGHDEAARKRYEEASRAYAEWLAATGNARQAERQAPADGAAPPPSGGFTSVEDIFSAFGDVFGDFFGGRRTAKPSGDLHLPVMLSEQEARRGGTREVVVKRGRPCTVCDATGLREKQAEPCATCAGKGVRQHQQGFFLTQTACGECRGTGSRGKPCPECKHGFVMFDETLTVTIPAGTTAGQQLRIPGKGYEGKAGEPAGNLYLLIALPPVEPTEGSAPKRKGDATESELEIDVRRFLVGGRARVETPTGPVTVKLPLFPKDGRVITLRDRGFPLAPTDAGYRGDMSTSDQKVVLRVSREVRSEAVKLVGGVMLVIAILILFAL